MQQQASLGIGLEIVSMGVSIYNLYKILQVSQDLNDVQKATTMIPQELIHESESIGNLTTSMAEITRICEHIVSSLYLFEEHVRRVRNFLPLPFQKKKKENT